MQEKKENRFLAKLEGVCGALFEFLFNAMWLVSCVKVSGKKALLPDYFLLRVNKKKEEGGGKQRKRGGKIDFDLPLHRSSAAEKRNDSFTSRHFRFLLSATVLSARAYY